MNVAIQVPFLDLLAMHREVEGELDEAWRAVTASSAFVGGPFVAQFEADWAAYCGTTYAVGVANGTDAIELSLRGLGVGPGDEVIVPANTFIATAEAVLATGATPHFVDVHPETLLVNHEAVAAAVSERTTAVLVVHLYGQIADMDSLLAVTEMAKVPLIEDAAQAHGATWRGRRAGSFGRAGCFSFYPGKNLGAFGDGGAVVTSDPELAARVRSIGDHGRDYNAKHMHPLVGRNSRLDGLQAAVLSAKLPRLDAWNSARSEAVKAYRRCLESGLVRPVKVDSRARSVHHLNVVRVPARDEVRAALAEGGVQTGIHYPVPCHLQPPYAGMPRGDVRVVEEAADTILSLPVYPHMTADHIDVVCAALSEVVRGEPVRVG